MCSLDVACQSIVYAILRTYIAVVYISLDLHPNADILFLIFLFFFFFFFFVPASGP